MANRFLAFDIGCLECGEDSKPLGVFQSKEEAAQAASKAEEAQKKDWHGQHAFEIYEIEVPD